MNAATISATKAYPDLCKEDVILGIMPIFHGFGLEVSINDAFSVGAEVILIPTFKANKFDELLRKYKPSVLVGVPTLFEALLKQKLKDKELECVEAVISGGDILTPELKKKVDRYLLDHGSLAEVRPGYGLTEATAATCLTNEYGYTEEGCIGIPFPDTYFKIVKIEIHF